MIAVWMYLVSSIQFISFLPSCLWEKAQYRLKYCLKEPLYLKQPSNQLSLTLRIWQFQQLPPGKEHRKGVVTPSLRRTRRRNDIILITCNRRVDRCLVKSHTILSRYVLFPIKVGLVSYQGMFCSLSKYVLFPIKVCFVPYQSMFCSLSRCVLFPIKVCFVPYQSMLCSLSRYVLLKCFI